MFVFGQGAAEAVASSYVEVRDLAWTSERRGQRVERAGVCDALMWPMSVSGVGEDLVEQVGELPVPVPDQKPGR